MSNEKAIPLQLRAQNVSIAYGNQTALQIPLLHTRGRCIAIIGHNGSGKSTFIKSILGLLVPRRGWIEASRDGETLVPEKNMAFSPENGSVFADISVESYLKLWCRIKCGDAHYYRHQGAQVIEEMSLFPLLSKLGRRLSKGERRRVQTAVGFLTSPTLFCFDEPFDGLDVQQSNHLTSIMQTALERMNLIISSHRMDVVERLADTIIVLKEGSILTSGGVEDVCQTLCNESVLIRHAAMQHVIANALVAELRTVFSHCVVHHVGSNVSITGNNIDLNIVNQFIGRYQLTDVKYERVRPTLTDAMSYHLQHNMATETEQTH